MTATEKYQTKITELLADKQKFQEYIYTPPMVAVKELKRRWNDKSIESGILVPSIFKTSPKAVLHRQLITPNYEVLRFMIIADGLNLEPVFFEYPEDKFVTENDWKYCLGRIHFFFGHGKKGGIKVERTNIIEFNKSNGKRIAEVQTLWGQDLVAFHHELFIERFPQFTGSIFDGSKWYFENGGCAKSYYKPFLSLFLKHGILFENFLLDSKELSFSRDVFLPAFLEIEEETGMKPLVVALDPTEMEEDIFWMCHPPDNKERVTNKLNSML